MVTPKWLHHFTFPTSPSLYRCRNSYYRKVRLVFCDDPAFKGQFELLALEKEPLEVAGEGKTIIIQLVERRSV